MKYSEFLSAIKLITTNYNSALTEQQLKIWEPIFIDLPSSQFRQAIQNHILDSDQGRFTPTPAHILARLIPSDNELKLIAKGLFEKDPTIDGTSTWDVGRETLTELGFRKRRYIADYLASWQRLDTHQKIDKQDGMLAIGGVDVLK